MKNDQNFLDKNTILAVLLVGLAWFGWQSYLNKKYPNMNTPVTQKNESTNQASLPHENTKANAGTATVLGQNKVELKPNSQIELKESFSELANEYAKFQISNFGLGIKGYELQKYTKRDKTQIQFAKKENGENENLFELSLLGQTSPIQFQVEKKSENIFLGTAQIGKMTIQREIEYFPDAYSFKNKVVVLNADENFKGIQLSISEKIETYGSGSFLIPSYEHQDFFVVHEGKKEERINITSQKEALDKTIPSVSTIALSNQYFSAAITDRSEIIPEVQVLANANQKSAKMVLTYKTASLKDKIELQFTSYVGPKTQATLEKADPNLTTVLNFGFFGAIGKILLIVLKWFQGFVGNWGVAIILLTILARLLVLPFNVASYKSMKKMQKIQPMLQSLRERYKDDPTRMNQETMLLMKEHKVNPIGGCLPMLLQMPIFFALFQVLGNSIEIYQAPFMFWIHDLSLKDPFYVLPILMGLTLFIQHKITPTTMDPAQAKVMQFMPVIFSLMMVSLPSGLTLYTFVSTLFGILQQRFFTRDTHSTILTKAKEAKA